MDVCLGQDCVFQIGPGPQWHAGFPPPVPPDGKTVTLDVNPPSNAGPRQARPSLRVHTIVAVDAGSERSSNAPFTQ